MQLQLQYSSFLSAKVIQKHTDTYYSSTYRYILVIQYFNNHILCNTFIIYSQYIIKN